MPAVQLERLKTEITNLAWVYTRPDEFHRRLRELLDTYSDRGYRAGKEVQAARFILVYHVPSLVISHIEIELVRLCRENPGAGFSLADELWQDDHLEIRRLAAFLLGQMPFGSADEVLERLAAWSKPEEEALSRQVLFQYGSWRLRRELPERWLEMIHTWVENESPSIQKMGLWALVPIVQDREFVNLPPVFSLIQPALLAAAPSLQGELQTLLIALDQRTPSETAYLLRQVIHLNPIPQVMRMMRRLLPNFCPATQENLRDVIKEFSKTE